MNDADRDALPDADLARLEDALQRAFATGDESGLTILGYGEVSCVVGVEAGGRRFACKRLPAFGDAAALTAYRRCFDDYLAALAARGIPPVPSTVRVVPGSEAEPRAWVVQPILPADGILAARFHHLDPAEATALFGDVVRRVLATVDGRIGLDAQLPNWVLVDGALRYLDVTTPMLRDGAGRERLDPDLFLASIPRLVRPLARRRLRVILDKYYDPRGVVLDILGNLHKERLTALLPPLLAEAAQHVTPAITAAEAHAYYVDDARGWELLQRARRLDRAWQRRVRRRPYPFLLPGAIRR